MKKKRSASITSLGFASSDPIAATGECGFPPCPIIHAIALPYFGFPRLAVAAAYYRHIPREPEALPEISSVFIPGAMEQYRSVKPKKGFHREKQEGMWLDGLEGTADTYKAMVLGPDYEEREANAALESQSELLMSLTFQLSSECIGQPCIPVLVYHCCTVPCCVVKA